MDDEGIIETVDFSEFENLFQKKTPQKKKTATKSRSKLTLPMKLSFGVHYLLCHFRED